MLTLERSNDSSIFQSESSFISSPWFELFQLPALFLLGGLKNNVGEQDPQDGVLGVRGSTLTPDFERSDLLAIVGNVSGGTVGRLVCMFVI